MQVVYVKKPVNLLLQISNWNRYFHKKIQKIVLARNFNSIGWNSGPFFIAWKKETLTWKFSKRSYFLPVKIKIHTWKNPKICPWKFWLPVKSCKIVCVKAIFCTWKNSKKGQKYVSRTLLIFTWKKKNCPWPWRKYVGAHDAF